MRTETFETITLISPAYNKERRIASTVSEVVTYFEKQALDYEIIVAVDGTHDLVNQMAPANSCLKVIGSKARRGNREVVKLATAKLSVLPM